jgi:hypothetical protein
MRRSLERFLQISAQQGAQRRDQEFRREMDERGFYQDLEKMDRTELDRLELADRGILRDLARSRLYGRGRSTLADQKALYDYKFTAEQKDREAKIRQALSLLDHDETLTPEDRQEARRELIYQWAGIEKLPVRKEDTPDLNSLLQYHPGTGSYYNVDSSGKIQEFSGSGIDMQKLLPLAINSATTENYETGKSETDWGQVGEFMQEAAKFGGGQRGGGAPQIDMGDQGRIAEPAGQEGQEEPDKGFQELQTEYETLFKETEDITGVSEGLSRDVGQFDMAANPRDAGDITSIKELKEQIAADRSLIEDLNKLIKKNKPSALPVYTFKSSTGIKKKDPGVHYGVHEKKIKKAEERIRTYESRIKEQEIKVKENQTRMQLLRSAIALKKAQLMGIK